MIDEWREENRVKGDRLQREAERRREKGLKEKVEKGKMDKEKRAGIAKGWRKREREEIRKAEQVRRGFASTGPVKIRSMSTMATHIPRSTVPTILPNTLPQSRAPSSTHLPSPTHHLLFSQRPFLPARPSKTHSLL